MEDTFNFHKTLEEWQETNRGKEEELALQTYKEKYYGDSKFGNHNLVPGTVYAMTRLLLPEEKGIVNSRPLFLSLGPKKQEGQRSEIVIDLCVVPYSIRPKMFTLLYKYYGKKLMHIAEAAEEGRPNKIPIQLSSKEASIVFKGIVPSASIISVPREAMIKIHPVDIGDWPMLCFMDTKGLGSRLPSLFAQYKQALGKRN